MRRVFIYKRFERFWHWAQAVLILLLALTGFEVHGSFHLFGFEGAVALHNILGWALIVLIAFAIFWHFTTGEWRQYIPVTQKLKEMVQFYLVGIFKHEPHPVKKSELSKLNPLQRLTYLGLKILALPVQVITGLLYLYYNSWPQWGIIGGQINAVAIIHTVSAFALMVFVLMHIYLATTGRTVTSNIKAMITGWEEIEE